MAQHKIGLAGAPGAGKTRLANQLAKAIDAKALDNYVPRLEKKTDNVFGYYGTHLENLMVAMDRIAIERAHRDESTITVGTLLDTITYEVMYGEMSLMAYNGEDIGGVQARIQTTLATFGMLVNDAWTYEWLFFVAHPEPNDIVAVYERTMLDLMDNFFIPVIRLDLPTVKENVELAHGIMREVEKSEVTSTDKQAVRQSGSAGEEVWDSTEPVSNVPVN